MSGRTARFGVLVGLACLGVAAAGVVGASAVRGHRPASDPLWTTRFPAGRRLLTNELAVTHPGTPGVRIDPQWIVTSGSLFADGGAGWTGPIDAATPDPASARTTGSAIFRAVTHRADFGDVAVEFDLKVTATLTTARTPGRDYDGVHVFVRYATPQRLYAVSVDRRDSTVAIKVKIPGGPSNGGDYTTLGQTRFPFPAGRWVHERVVVVNVSGGVAISLATDGRRLLSVTDHGRAGAGPLTSPGRVGLRGDNTAFYFRSFRVCAAAPSSR